MRRCIIIILILLTSLAKAQRRSESYTLEGYTLQRGDTLHFIKEGTPYVYAFYRVGRIQKRRASFTGKYTKLPISYFILHKKRAIVYAVLKLPNKSGWTVWVHIEEALRSGEITLTNN